MKAGEGVWLAVVFFGFICMHILYNAYISCYIPVVKQKMEKTTLQQDFLKKLLPLWPALKGSLAQVRKPCIRPDCPTCARGDKHPNYLLAFTDKGKRRCLYVPRAMVPVIQRALENGRRIEQLLYQTGPALLRDYRAKNPAKTGPATRLKRKNTTPKS